MAPSMIVERNRMGSKVSGLENRNVVIDSVLLVLSNTFSNPSDISHLLLLGSQPCPHSR